MKYLYYLAPHRLDIFISDEAFIEFGAEYLELSVEIVGWLLVGVDDLTQDLLVVVDHVCPADVPVVMTHAARDVQSHWVHVEHHVFH